MTKTINFKAMIASSACRRAEIEHRIERMVLELRDELEELTGTVWRDDSVIKTGFILITERSRPAKVEVRK